MSRNRFRFTAALLFALAVACAPAAAHDLPTNTLMNAFVKIDATQAQLVVRLPLDLVRGLPFPQKGAQYDLAASGPVTELALLTLAEVAKLTETDSKDKLVDRLQSSFDFCATALANLDDSHMSETLTMGETKASRAMTILTLSGSWTTHYSLQQDYLQLSGQVPTANR